MWLVCFTNRQADEAWWEKLLRFKQGFRHCYTLQYQADPDKWVLVDWRLGICDVLVFDSDELKYIITHLSATNGRAVLYKGRLPERDIPFRIPVMYCVQAALQVLGMPTNWTFTPEQLYKRLMRKGGKVIVDYS